MDRDGHSPHHIDQLTLSPREITGDLLGRFLRPGPRYQGALGVSGALFLVGMAGFILRALGGFDDRLAWGYYAATVAFLLSTAMAAPLVAFAFRLAKADWRRPLTRASELWGVTSILGLIMLVPLLFLIPSNQGRFTVWFDWPHLAPHLWLVVGMLVFVGASLVALWIPALPDLAAARDAAPGRRLFRRLALRWSGTPLQWQVLQTGVIMTGAFFLMNLVFIHFLFPSDFAIALVPGWKDAIFPAYHAVTALQGGMATLVVTLYVLRRWGGLEEYIRMEQFWALSKPLLAVSLMWFYFWWSGFIIYWYGRLPAEQGILRLFQFEVYRWPFFLAFLLCFVIPLIVLIWNPVRKSILGPTLVSCFILVGLFLDRVRIYVGAFSVPAEKLGDHVLEEMPAVHLPDAIDVLIIVGGISGAIFFYLLGSRLAPVLSLWEVKEGTMLRVVRPFLRGTYTVIGKPR